MFFVVKKSNLGQKKITFYNVNKYFKHQVTLEREYQNNVRRTNLVKVFQLEIDFWPKSGGLRPKKQYASLKNNLKIFHRNFKKLFFPKLSIFLLLVADFWDMCMKLKFMNTQSESALIGAL